MTGEGRVSESTGILEVRSLELLTGGWMPSLGLRAGHSLWH